MFQNEILKDYSSSERKLTAVPIQKKLTNKSMTIPIPSSQYTITGLNFVTKTDGSFMIKARMSGADKIDAANINVNIGRFRNVIIENLIPVKTLVL